METRNFLVSGLMCGLDMIALQYWRVLKGNFGMQVLLKFKEMERLLYCAQKPLLAIQM